MSDTRPPSPSSSHLAAGSAFARLLQIMQALRTPQTGCPWDLEQDFSTIAPYTIEEAYEVADAIERNNMPELRDELGDLLFQVAFHSQMADEAGHFTAADVAEAIAQKMVRRHPHVFDQPDDRDADGQTVAWEEMKAAERAAKGADRSVLDDVALALPALMRAEKLQKRAARVGFDWTEPEPIFDKLGEETEELKEAMASGDQTAVAEEMGDMLFVCANLARRLGVDPEIALRAANSKFERRFRAMEALASERGEAFGDLDLEAQEALWQAVKQKERSKTEI
ncbi:MAG: nucleoside triphosphate pyrophosphohydrolase [Hyphomonadaceae bacterium]|nr:nucleoside triphosphate pyrophosphohydrolase [Hyphomonadaceae bacterium]